MGMRQPLCGRACAIPKEHYRRPHDFSPWPQCNSEKSFTMFSIQFYEHFYSCEASNNEFIVHVL
jgi:hypothetical protein